jgi:endonuclease/exonuclease/phosphatase family metal-dependent hydrolase
MKHKSILTILLLIFIGINSNAKNNLKIITYNIWNGFDWGKNLEKQTKFVNWVKEQCPDVLAMQELCAFTEEKLQKLAKQWGHNYVAIAKEGGYPVGISSKYPIVVKEKIIKGMHHGALHCKIKEIDFFVIHFSPFDCVKRLQEVRIVESKMKALDKFVMLGDFNSLSPFDYSVHKKNGTINNYGNPMTNKNLVHGNLDYSAISRVLSIPMYDACVKSWNPISGGTCPTVACFEGKYHKQSEILERQERIDFVFLSKSLYPKLRKARIIHSDFTNYLSDHYPVEVELGE